MQYAPLVHAAPVPLVDQQHTVRHSNRETNIQNHHNIYIVTVGYLSFSRCLALQPGPVPAMKGPLPNGLRLQ